MLPDPPRGMPRASWVYRACAGVIFTVFRLQGWRHDVRGIANVPTRQGAVIAANHFSFWDFFLVARGPYLSHGRPVRILAKASLFDTPVFGWLMRRAGHIPVHRAAGGEALQSAVEALHRGELVLILPEATISPAHELLEFKTGAARLRTVVAGLVDDLVATYPDGAPTGAWWVPARHGGGAPTPEEADAYLQRLRSGWARGESP